MDASVTIAGAPSLQRKGTAYVVAIGINQYGSNAAAPFGGHKASGLGTEQGPEGLAQYLAYTSIYLPR